jgi:hypothetical protein
VYQPYVSKRNTKESLSLLDEWVIEFFFYIPRIYKRKRKVQAVE